MKEEISHWLIMVGNPEEAGKTRKEAREVLKRKRATHDNREGYLYIGKCIKRNDRPYLVLEL